MAWRLQLFALCVLFISTTLVQSNVLSSKINKDNCEAGLNCKLPDCFCRGTQIPKGLKAKDIPQMIMITFDDAVNVQVFKFVEAIVNGGITNPNGCKISTTYFNSHEWTDYFMLNDLYHQRQEVADHTITHRTPIPWWKNATYTQ